MTVYKTPHLSANGRLFDGSRKEILESLGSPLEILIDVFNFERHREKITECVRRETLKKRLQATAESFSGAGLFESEDLPKATLKDAIKLAHKDSRGRRPHDPVLMFTIVMFGVRFRVSDEELAFLLRDSYSFRVFLSLPEDYCISRQAIWQYREYFTNGGLCETLAREHVDELSEAGLIGTEARILDGSFVEARKQRNTREENRLIKKENKTAQDLWGDQPAKARQKDTDARWAKKGNEPHFGYKAHAYADEKSKLVVYVHTTPANVHDSQVLENVLGDDDRGMSFFADSAYSGKPQLDIIKSFGMYPLVCEKGTSKTPLTEEQNARNRKKSSRRCRIEHIFGFIENSMGGSFVRCVGIKRTAAYQWLTMFAYNLCRQVQLQT